MMDTRAWRADFDVSDSEGRIISGIAVPYNSPTTIYENGRIFEETWKPGSTRDTIAKRGDRMKLLGFHEARTWPLGRPVGLEDRKAGFWLEARVSDTSAGNDALTLVRDKVLDGFSVGFTVPEGGDTFTQTRDGLQRTINRADIHEVSLVNFPAFDEARVHSIREAQEAVDEGSPIVNATTLSLTSSSCGTAGSFITIDAAQSERAEEWVPDEELIQQQLRLQVLRVRALAR